MSSAFQRLGEIEQCGLPTQIVADPRVVADVVAVKAARPGLQDWRGVDVADAQVVQVRNELAPPRR